MENTKKNNTAHASGRQNWSAPPLDCAPASSGTGGLDLEDSRLIAYMLNPNYQVVWCNQAAREHMFGVASLHPSAEMRNIFLLLASVQGDPQDEVISLHAGLAKPHLTRANLLSALRIVDEDRAIAALDLFSAAKPIESRSLLTVGYKRCQGAVEAGAWQVMCAFFREGSLFVHAPQALASELFVNGLGDRAAVMRRVSSQQSPMLTSMAVIVADLQDSVRLCAELPPHSYFQLINQVMSLCNGIIMEFNGQIGKHAGDGVVAYFFPHPSENYLDNCVRCSLKIKEGIRRLSHEWQLERGWLNTLHLNVGLHEGQEWVGAFEIGDTFQLSAMGDTINHAARLSEFASKGSIWATKQLVTRLESEVGTVLDYGITFTQSDSRPHFVRSSFAQIQSLLLGSVAETSKVRSIATMAVTEILGASDRCERD